MQAFFSMLPVIIGALAVGALLLGSRGPAPVPVPVPAKRNPRRRR